MIGGICRANLTDESHSLFPRHFKQLSVDDGLSHNTIMALSQDRLGRMWVGTIDGLNRYDGYDFTTFYSIQGDSSTLANDHIFSLLTDSKGTVWVGTLTGLSRYNVVDDNFTNYALPDNLPDKVHAIKEIGEDRLLLGTERGLMYFDKQIEQIIQPDSYRSDLSVFSICQVKGRILLGTSKGLFLHDTDSQRQVPIVAELRNEVISTIIHDSGRQCYWVGSLSSGLYYMDDDFRIKRHYTHQSKECRLPTDAVRKLAVDNDGKLWIGTMGELFTLDPTAGKIEKLSLHSDKMSPYRANSIRSILQDNQGGMWIGTYYGGLYYYHPLAPTFETWLHSDYVNSISDNTVSCIVETPGSGNIWLGTNNGGLNEYDRKRKRFTAYRSHLKNPHSLQSDNIKCLLPDEQGIYIGTHGGGLSYLSFATRSIRNYNLPDAVAVQNSCYSLLDSGDGTLWVGTMVGLYQFDKQSRRLQKHPVAWRFPALDRCLINVLYKDSKNRIWIGTEQSLFCYAAGKLTEVKDASISYAPSLIQAFCIYEDRQKRIWIGSSNGLYRYVEETPYTPVRYSVQDGLPNEFIYCILEDEQGRLWITTNRGLSCFSPLKETFQNYTKHDGLSHEQFNHYGACRTGDGIFFLGTFDGVTYFNPRHFVPNPFVSAAVITGVSVQNTRLKGAGDGAVRLHQTKDGRLTKLSLPFIQKQFSIHFSTINYLADKRNLFAYRLKGFDDNWIYLSQAAMPRMATYSNLSPGTYLFQVKACNNSGEWSSEVTGFEVEILPMWYQTWWAKSIYVLLALALLMGIIYFYVARARMRMRIQWEQLEKKNTEEMAQEKIRFYINMSHELRTPLSLILAPIEELNDEKSNFTLHVQQKLEYIYKNSHRLLHTINQLLEFRKAESGALPIHVRLGHIERAVQNIFDMFVDTAKKRNINYCYHATLPDEVPFDPVYLEIMLTNLLSNAFKYTLDGGEIILSLTRQDNNYCLSVTDNGVGIAPDKLPHIFERFYQADNNQKGTGIGLSLVKCLVEKHHGTIEVESIQGEGTSFCIYLPMDITVFAPEECALEQGDEGTSLPASWAEQGKVGREFVQESADSISDEVPAGEGSELAYTLLFVDDNRDMTEYLKSNFGQQYVTLTASNGKEALAILKAQKVDLVVSDVMMPVMDGIQLCEQMKRNLQICHIPIILLSAKGSVEAQTSGIQTGADDYIPKPFSIHLLKAKVAGILKSRERMKNYFLSTITPEVTRMTTNTLDAEFMEKVIAVVKENLNSEDFTADNLAEQLCLSRSSLYLKMNAISGEPPANFIRRIRFNEACRLLREKRYTVAEISNRVGYSNPANFSTAFKKYVGCLPTEYVKNKCSPEGNRTPI